MKDDIHHSAQEKDKAAGHKGPLLGDFLGALSDMDGERENKSHHYAGIYQAWKVRRERGARTRLNYSQDDPGSYRTYDPMLLDMLPNTDPFQRIYNACSALEVLGNLLHLSRHEMGRADSMIHNPATFTGISEILGCLRDRIHDAAAFAEDFYNCDAVKEAEGKEPEAPGTPKEAA